jgi:hypothetical protein
MASPAPPGTGGRKILGLKPKTALFASVGIVGGALAWFWWRGRQSKTTAASSASASSSAAAYSGSGQLDVIQAELDQLLQNQDQDQGSAPGSGGSGSGGTDNDGTGGTGGKGGGAGTKTKPKPAMPSAHETKVTATSVTISWGKVPDATHYRVRVTYQGKLVGSPHIVTGTSATISGLGRNRTYTFHVAAIGPGGTSSETNGPAVKTKL